MAQRTLLSYMISVHCVKIAAANNFLAVKCDLESSSHRLYESAGGNARNGLRNSEWGLPISYGKSDSCRPQNFRLRDSRKGFLPLSLIRRSGGIHERATALAGILLKNRPERLETPLPWSLGD